MVRILLTAAIALSTLPLSAAQAQSLFGSSGALNSTSSSTGSSGSRSSSGGTGSTGSTGSSGFGSNGSTGSGMSGGGGGSSGGGASGGLGGTSSLTQSSLNAADGTLGQSIGASGFVGRGDTAGRFVGSQNASQQRVIGAAQQFSQLQNMNNQNGGNNSNTTVKQRLRPQVQLGFQPPAEVGMGLPATLQTRLSALPAMENRANGVLMTADEFGQVTLSGSVASEDDRRLMEILTRMEPGVRSVKNELQVGP